MAVKKVGSLKVHEQSGYNYKANVILKNNYNQS